MRQAPVQGGRAVHQLRQRLRPLGQGRHAVELGQRAPAEAVLVDALAQFVGERGAKSRLGARGDAQLIEDRFAAAFLFGRQQTPELFGFGFERADHALRLGQRGAARGLSLLRVRAGGFGLQQPFLGLRQRGARFLGRGLGVFEARLGRAPLIVQRFATAARIGGFARDPRDRPLRLRGAALGALTLGRDAGGVGVQLVEHGLRRPHGLFGCGFFGARRLDLLRAIVLAQRVERGDLGLQPLDHLDRVGPDRVFARLVLLELAHLAFEPLRRGLRLALFDVEPFAGDQQLLMQRAGDRLLLAQLGQAFLEFDPLAPGLAGLARGLGRRLHGGVDRRLRAGEILRRLAPTAENQHALAEPQLGRDLAVLAGALRLLSEARLRGSGAG